MDTTAQDQNQSISPASSSEIPVTTPPEPQTHTSLPTYPSFSTSTPDSTLPIPPPVPPHTPGPIIPPPAPPPLTPPPEGSHIVTAKRSRFIPFTIGIIVILIFLLIGALLLARNLFQKELQANNAGTSNQYPPTYPSSVPSTTLEKVVRAGKIVIGSDTTYPPMESLDDKGNAVGYDMDLGNKIAEGLGLKAEFVSVPFDDIFNQLDQKKFDIIISAVTITDERKQKYLFSDPYLNAGEVIITRKDTVTIKTPTDLKLKKVGVEKNTIEEQVAPRYTSADLVMSYPDNDHAISDLVAGKLDAVLTDLPNAKGIVDKNLTLKIASDPFTDEVYGIVFRKGDEELMKKVNDVLTGLRETGYLTDLKHKWLE